MAIIVDATKVTRDSMASDLRQLTGLLLQSQMADTVAFEIMNTVIDWVRGLGVPSIDQHYQTEITGLNYAQGAGQDPHEYFIDLTTVHAVDQLKIQLRDEYGKIHVKDPGQYNNRMDFIRISPNSSKRYRLAKIIQFGAFRQAAVVYIGSAYTLGAAVIVDYPRMPERPASGAAGLDIPAKIISPVRDLMLRQIYMDVIKQPMPIDVETRLRSVLDGWIGKNNLRMTAKEEAA